MADFITIAQVKDLRGITVTTSDALLTTLVARVSQAVRNYCKRDFEAQTYTEYQDGKGTDEILVNQFPINSITSLTHVDENDTVVYTWTSTDYARETWGLIRLRDGIFKSGIKNIKIVYNAGYTTIPVDLQQACIAWVSWLFEDRNQQRLGIISRIMNDGGSLRYTQHLPVEVGLILDMYVKHGN